VIIGGYVVHDPALPSFRGRYLYGRYQSGVYALDATASGRAARTGAEVEDLTSFGLDEPAISTRALTTVRSTGSLRGRARSR
jgi:hypothetical protein